MSAEAPLSRFVLSRNPAQAPAGLEHPVVAIGNFDGVHQGHAVVIGRAVDLARRLGRPAAVVTFEPHPVDYFRSPGTVFRLTPEEAKAHLVARQGLAGMIVLPFDATMASTSAERFVADILVARLQISGAVVGYDFHFGQARGGSPEFLADAGARYGFPVEIVDEVTADSGGVPEAIHSNLARQALERGDVREARRLLGHPWFIVGEVVHGQKLGRKLGFPTANVVLDPSCRLRHGIYAVRLRVDGSTHDGVANYGRRPTVTDSGAPLLETFVFDFSGNLYGKHVEVEFVDWIRGEEKFDGLDALVAAMNRDREQALAVLRS